MAKNYTPLPQTVTPAKEAEPIPFTTEKIEIKEHVEKEPDEEVKKFISTHKETIELPPDLKKMGLQSASTTNFPTTQVTLPISDDKIMFGLQKPVTSSWRWLAELAVYILKTMHITLKRIHGKVMRVIKS